MSWDYMIVLALLVKIVSNPRKVQLKNIELFNNNSIIKLYVIVNIIQIRFSRKDREKQTYFFSPF